MDTEYEYKNDENKDTKLSFIAENDDDKASVNLPAELPPPPDGGWGWIIVVASFMITMVVDGMAYAFSPYLIVYSEYFEEPQGKVAWISSIMCGVCLIAGPIVSSLVNKFGCRIVCISGALFTSAAFASTALANSVTFLMITQGLLAGFGFGMLYLPAIICVGYYFETKRAMATGMAVCGSGIGTIVFPPLAKFLIEKIGWQRSNLCFAALILSLGLMGALMRPLEVSKMKRKDLLQRLAEEKKLALEIGSLYGSGYIVVTHSDGTVEKRIRPESNVDPGVHSYLNLSGNNLSPVGTALTLPTIKEGQPITSEVISITEEGGRASKDLRKEKLSRHISMDEESIISMSPSRKYAIGSALSLSEANKFLRNMSQQSIDKNNADLSSKLGSVVSFEKKLSKMDLVNMMKVIPGVAEPIYTNFGSSNKIKTTTCTDSGTPRLMHLSSKESTSSSISLPPMARQDIFYSGHIKHLEEFKSQNSMVFYRESTFNLQEMASRVIMEFLEPEDEVDLFKEGQCSSIKNGCGLLCSMVDFSLMKNPVFLLIGFANMIGMLGFYTPFIYLPTAALEKGIDQNLTTLLISIIGVASTTGRILSGIVSSIPKVNVLWVSNISMIVSALSIFLIPFAYDAAGFIAISICFGFFSAAFLSLTSIILVDLLGLRNLTNSFGLLLLFRGLASMIGSPLAGTIYDATDSYDVSFYLSGIMLFICAMMHLAIPLVKNCHPNPHEVIMYHTNEDYLQAIPEEEVSSEDEDQKSQSPDAEGGIMFTIHSKLKSKLSFTKDTDSDNKSTEEDTV